MRYVSKKFLNDSVYETGSIVVTVQSPKTPDQIKSYDGVESTVTLRDCNSTIHLDFQVSSDEGLQNRLSKLDVLIDELLNAKNELMLQWEYVSKHRPTVVDAEDTN